MEVRFLADQTLPDAFVAVRFTRIDADYCIAEATIQSGGMRGHLAEVWFFRRAVARFVADLRAGLAGTGSGEAELDSISPGECVLRIRSLSPGGEASVEASVGRFHLAIGVWAWDRTTVNFPLSPGGWDDVLGDLDTILS